MPRHYLLSCTVVCTTLLGLTPQFAKAEYIQVNLTSDIPGLAAFTDANLKNPWGMTNLPTSPFWVADQRTNVATLYNGAGLPQALVVTTPVSPTGAVANGTTSFELAPNEPARFIFATSLGQIAAWNPSVSPTSTVTVATTPAASYTGLAIATPFGGPNLLYAANIAGGRIDVFNGAFAPTTLAGNFTDPNLPAGLRPFNIQALAGRLFVTYAPAVPAPNQGIVDIFDLNGNFQERLITNDHLNSPWGVTLASANFGQFSGDLLVGNFGDGSISAFDPTTGAFLGQLLNQNLSAILIPGLRSLVFRGGTGFDPNALYFTAGINNGLDGLFGEIQVAATPLPAALPLFAAGLGALGLLGWRRKRKTAALGAA